MISYSPPTPPTPDPERQQSAPKPSAYSKKGLRRSPQQNRKYWALLQNLSQQVRFAGRMWDKESWNAIVLGALYGQDVVENPFRGGMMVVNRIRSSDLRRSAHDGPENMDDLINEIVAWGNEQKVQWSEPSKQL